MYWLKVAGLIIGNIDDAGFLQTSADELVFSSGQQASHIQTVLDVIQAFHPPGVGARDLRECLMLQLERADRVESLEYQIVRECMDGFGPPAHQGDCQESSADRGRGAGVDQRIGHLEPKPGREYLPDTEQYVVPEVFIRRGDDGEWKVTSNHEHVPEFRISNAYKDLMAQAATSSEVRDYIRDKIRSGEIFDQKHPSTAVDYRQHCQ